MTVMAVFRWGLVKGSLPVLKLPTVSNMNGPRALVPLAPTLLAGGRFQLRPRKIERRRAEREVLRDVSEPRFCVCCRNIETTDAWPLKSEWLGLKCDESARR